MAALAMGEMRACGNCTLLNSSSASICEMCEQPLPPVQQPLVSADASIQTRAPPPMIAEAAPHQSIAEPTGQPALTKEQVRAARLRALSKPSTPLTSHTGAPSLTAGIKAGEEAHEVRPAPSAPPACAFDSDSDAPIDLGNDDGSKRVMEAWLLSKDLGAFLADFRMLDIRSPDELALTSLEQLTDTINSNRKQNGQSQLNPFELQDLRELVEDYLPNGGTKVADEIIATNAGCAVPPSAARTESERVAEEMGVTRAEARKLLDEDKAAKLQQRPTGFLGPAESAQGGPKVDDEIIVTDAVCAVPPSLARTESERVAQNWGVTQVEARKFIDEQNAVRFQQDRHREQCRRDEEYAATLKNVVEQNCVICGDDYLVEEMYTSDCKHSHRTCYECVKRKVEFDFGRGSLPTCAHMCGYTMSAKEIKEIYGKNSSEVNVYETLLLRNTLAGDKDSFIKCPFPGCDIYSAAGTPGRREECLCQSCKFHFCSLCKTAYHYQLACAEVGPTAETWFKWIREDSRKFRADFAKASKTLEAIKHAEQQFQNLQKDEEWKEQNCRLCPHCNKCVYKVDGCDTMTCGRDAADKGGGNRQDGCGKKFNWEREAKPYKRGHDRLHLPRELSEVDLELAKEIHHYLIHPENLEAGDSIDNYRVHCDACHTPIKGPRFSCIHCSSGLNLCIRCEGDLTNGKESSDACARATAVGHGHNHIFQIYFETSHPPHPSDRVLSFPDDLCL